MNTGTWYNGYDDEERTSKFVELKRLVMLGVVPSPSGSCSICNDSKSVLEYHSEDYGKPFIFTPPAMYVLCRGCHRYHLHRRFKNPERWSTFLAHIRRGGFARDYQISEVRREIETYFSSLNSTQEFTMRSLRPYTKKVGTEWFANLSIDCEALTAKSSRARG